MIPWWTLLIVVPCVCSVAVAVFAVVCGGSAYDRGYGDGHRAGWEGSREVQFSDDNLYGQSPIERGAFSRILEKAERERDEARAENERLRDERHRLEIKLDAAIHSIEGRELPWLRQRNEQLTRALDQACANLAVHHGTREEGRTIGDDAELWKACLLAGWGGWQGYREEFGDVRMQSDEDDAALAAAQEPPAKGDDRG